MSGIKFLQASESQLAMIYRLTIQEPEFWHVPEHLVSRADFDSYGKRWFVGTDTASGKVIGYCALGGHDKINRSGSVGILVSRELRGSGAVLHLARAFVDMLFLELGLHTLMSDSREGAPMGLMAERFGWTRVGLLRDVQMIRGEWRNRVIHQKINPYEQESQA